MLIMRYPIGLGLLAAVPVVILLILLGIALGLLITPVGMLYNDVGSGLPMVVQLWFFLTPVIYPPPTSFPYSPLGWLNPVSPLVVSARDLAVTGTWTMPLATLGVGAFVIATLLVGWVFYRVAMPIIIERMSA
jgi:lipopolysaccharide transport system permease protein